MVVLLSRNSAGGSKHDDKLLNADQVCESNCTCLVRLVRRGVRKDAGMLNPLAAHLNSFEQLLVLTILPVSQGGRNTDL
jgi:hypothetical protein